MGDVFHENKAAGVLFVLVIQSSGLQVVKLFSPIVFQKYFSLKIVEFSDFTDKLFPHWEYFFHFTSEQFFFVRSNQLTHRWVQIGNSLRIIDN